MPRRLRKMPGCRATASGQSDHVRISAHSIFVDPVLVDRLANMAQTRVGCDYIGYAGHDGRPAAASAQGLFVEWVRVEALEKADREAHLLVDREHVTRYIYSPPRRIRRAVAAEPTSTRRTLDASSIVSTTGNCRRQSMTRWAPRNGTGIASPAWSLSNFIAQRPCALPAGWGTRLPASS